MSKESESAHRNRIKNLVRLAMLKGETSCEDILFIVGGADPLLVADLKNEIEATEQLVELRQTYAEVAARARRETASLPNRLPAADPMRSQWWFTLESAVALSDTLAALTNRAPVAFLGTPTVASHYCIAHNDGSALLDIDRDVVDAVNLPASSLRKRYDVVEALPQNTRGRYSAVLLDPPWYPDMTDAFIRRGRELVVDGGFLLCILPPTVTRPGITNERNALLRELLEAQYEVISITERFVRYYVPGFEEAVFHKIGAFSGRVWRTGDLLVSRVGSASTHPTKFEKQPDTYVFSRNANKLRIFLRPALADPAMHSPLELIPEFEANVSTRAFAVQEIAIWTSSKRAARVKDPSKVQLILQQWASGKTKAEAVAQLEKTGVRNADASATVEAIERSLGIWAESISANRRSSAAALEERRQLTISEFAASPSAREHPHASDGYRLEFQRDRDRVLWSHSLKRLSNKAQVFDFRSDEHLRRRLSHSIEVMQLASTIASAFGLDRDLTEAGALAHDLGHTPFGHAGEFALNGILQLLTNGSVGFNHYEHGVDVVRWLEDVYQSPGVGGFPGLNLTPETMECIFKHTYFRDGHTLGQDEMWRVSKHQSLISDDSCHLEGQSVRIADKISYLISDIEDGIRTGVFALDDVLDCRLFARPSIDLRPEVGETLFDRFISQRRAILQILMEDVLNETDRRLAAHSSLASIRAQKEYVVNHSTELDTEVKEVWRKLQSGRLHPHPDVAAANRRAAEITTTLFLLFAVRPEVMNDAFRHGYERLTGSDYLAFYVKAVGESVDIPVELVDRFFLDRTIGAETRREQDHYRIPTVDVIRSKDYVASLTDGQAVAIFKDLLDVAR